MRPVWSPSIFNTTGSADVLWSTSHHRRADSVALAADAHGPASSAGRSTRPSSRIAADWLRRTSTRSPWMTPSVAAAAIAHRIVHGCQPRGVLPTRSSDSRASSSHVGRPKRSATRRYARPNAAPASLASLESAASRGERGSRPGPYLSAAITRGCEPAGGEVQKQASSARQTERQRVALVEGDLGCQVATYLPRQPVGRNVDPSPSPKAAARSVSRSAASGSRGWAAAHAVTSGTRRTLRRPVRWASSTVSRTRCTSLALLARSDGRRTHASGSRQRGRRDHWRALPATIRGRCGRWG